ncbi:MAG: hypothetical protein JSU86_07410, partial [Phycisphaerales bacterium]
DDDCICPPSSRRSGLAAADECNLGACEPFFFGGFDEHGTAIALPLDFVLRDVLRLQKNPSQPDAIVAGVNRRVDTVAVGDDIQVVPIGTDGLNDRTIVVLAGENGVLDTLENNVCIETPGCPSDPDKCCDDVPANTTGYETSPTCNADTAASINEPETDGDGIASTEADGDDVQVVARGLSVSPGDVIVSAGPNGILETVVAGDDEYRGPGEPCAPDNDCPGGTCTDELTCEGGERDTEPCDCPGGTCNGREVLVRFENSKTGDPNRFWVVLTSEEICHDPPAECPFGIPAGSHFGDIPLRPTQAVTLAFGQDIDRDGLFAREEFIYGSSDQKKDTDDDTLHDPAEIREGWEVHVKGLFPEQVYPDPRFEDSDFDGLKDPVEQECLTDPTRRDTDGDGLFDVIELGITTDFNGNDEIDDYERGFGRCCIEGGACASEPTVPCRSDDDCADVIGFPVCLPYVLRVARCCTDATETECAPNPTLACDASQSLAHNGEFEENAEGWELGTGEPTGYFKQQTGPGWNGEEGYFSLNDGSNYGGDRTWISQEVTGLVPGDAYVVSGYYRSGYWQGPGPSFQVKIDDVVYFEAGEQEVTDWTAFEFTFFAAASQATLEIRAEVCCVSDYDVDGICVDSMCRGDYPYTGVTDHADLDGICPPQGVPLEWPERLDPRNPDTDGDTIEDADELELALNPLDPGDADDFTDADQDGLYDVVEMAGWVVEVYKCELPDCAGGINTEWCETHPGCVYDSGADECVCFSDSLEGDSDFDGLPDLLEYLGADGIRPGDPGDSGDATNPQDDDTDCDG